MTTKIGVTGSEATVADPVHRPPHTTSIEHRGAVYRTKDGTTRRHVAATKRTWTVLWETLTDSQYTTLAAELNRTVALSWLPPAAFGGGTYTVLVVGWRRIDDGSRGLCVEAELIEV